MNLKAPTNITKISKETFNKFLKDYFSGMYEGRLGQAFMDTFFKDVTDTAIYPSKDNVAVTAEILLHYVE